MGDRRRHQSGALNGAASGGEENAVGEKRRGTPERRSPGSSELFLIYLWLESGFMPAPTFLFALAPQAGARLLLRCAPGEKRTIRILQKSKRYNISFQGIVVCALLTCKRCYQIFPFFETEQYQIDRQCTECNDKQRNDYTCSVNFVLESDEQQIEH